MSVALCCHSWLLDNVCARCRLNWPFSNLTETVFGHTLPITKSHIHILYREIPQCISVAKYGGQCDRIYFKNVLLLEISFVCYEIHQLMTSTCQCSKFICIVHFWGWLFCHTLKVPKSSKFQTQRNLLM